jgi:HAT1-interacting factor 1
MRKEAATQMEHAIASCKVRMAQEEKKLEAEKDEDEDKATATKRKIANVKEIVTEMEQRVSVFLFSPSFSCLCFLYIA